jgi:Fic family protein
MIRHIAHFVSRLWQIHVFGEGNTRTTAVFLILYLRALGFDVTNEVFAENAWYFRNALVRANYNDLKNGIRETTAYLEMFLRNLLLGEKHELRNRDLHIGETVGKQDIEAENQDIETEKQDIEARFPYDEAMKRMNANVNTTAHVLKMYKTFGLNTVFARGDVCELTGITASPASALLKRLLENGIITPVAGLGKGKYRFVE